MSVFPIDRPPLVFSATIKSGVWRKLAQAIDAYCVRRSKRIVPDVMLRRCKREEARCRQLMPKQSAMPIEDAADTGRAGQCWT